MPTTPLNSCMNFYRAMNQPVMRGMLWNTPISVWGYLGYVLSVSAGMPFEELLKQQVLEPLGMADTFITLSTEREKYLTSGYDITGAVTPHWSWLVLSSAGALISTPKDMMLYLKVNMGITDSPLSNAIEMSHSFLHGFDSRHSVGFAWLITAGSDDVTVWHNGGTGGYRSFIGFDNKARGVVVLANFQGQCRQYWTINP